MILIDPCPEATFFLKENPFTNDTYYLRDPLIEKVWVDDDLVEVFTQADCGAITVEFFYFDTSAFDTRLFSDTRGTPNSFQVLETQLLSDVGVYEITYRVMYSGKSLVKEFPFTVTIIDPCDEPISITPGVLVDQEYTLMQAAFDYIVP